MPSHSSVQGSRAPLYKEVEREIIQCLARGEWKPGDRIPTEAELAERFGVAVFTIRAGIQKLVESGILRRHQGKGTFVALHRSRPLRYQFLRIYNNDGDRARWDRELISVKKKRADDETARLLRLEDSAAERAVFDVLFLLKNEDKALAFVESKMPAKIFGVVPEAVLRNTTDNFYAVFQERFGVNVIQTQERVWAVHAGSRGARWLGVRSSEPMLRIERIAYTYNDVPVELRYYNVRADRYCYLAPPQ